MLNTKLNDNIQRFSKSRIIGPSIPGNDTVVLSDVLYTVPHGYRAFYVIMVYFSNEAAPNGTVTIGVSENDVNSELVKVGATAKGIMLQCFWNSNGDTRLKILMRQSTGKFVEKPVMYISGLIIKDI